MSTDKVEKFSTGSFISPAIMNASTPSPASTTTTSRPDQERPSSRATPIDNPYARARTGEIPGALIVERNVLEWRFDPASDARLPEATGYDLQVIIVCSEGYTSSLAAASLHDLGLRHATDVIGGFYVRPPVSRSWVKTEVQADPGRKCCGNIAATDLGAWWVDIGPRPAADLADLVAVGCRSGDATFRCQGREGTGLTGRVVAWRAANRAR